MKFVIIYLLCFSNNLTIAQQANLNSFRNLFDKAFRSWTKTFDQFNLGDFKIAGETSFEEIDYMDFSELKDFFDVYKPALSFSPDKNQFIDIYSYWLNLSREGSRIISRGGEADQAITLCNLKTKTWKRIMFRGTTERIVDATWIDNNSFILVASSQNAHSADFSPVIYRGDIKLRLFKIYISNNAHCIEKTKNYKSAKLKHLHVKEL